MRAAFASASFVSAAVLLGCEAPVPEAEEKGAELRRASYRSFGAAERLWRCGWARRARAAHELRRYETLKDFARRRGPGAAERLWQGENAWRAVARSGAPAPCGGDADYEAAVAEFGGTLDGVANGIMGYED